MLSTHKHTSSAQKLARRWSTEGQSHQPCASPHPQAACVASWQRLQARKEQCLSNRLHQPWFTIQNVTVTFSWGQISQTKKKIIALQIKAKGGWMTTAEKERLNRHHSMQPHCLHSLAGGNSWCPHPSHTSIHHLCMNREATARVPDTQKLSFPALWVPGGRQCSRPAELYKEGASIPVNPAHVQIAWFRFPKWAEVGPWQGRHEEGVWELAQWWRVCPDHVYDDSLISAITHSVYSTVYSSTWGIWCLWPLWVYRHMHMLTYRHTITCACMHMHKHR